MLSDALKVKLSKQVLDVGLIAIRLAMDIVETSDITLLDEFAELNIDQEDKATELAKALAELLDSEKLNDDQK